tara:strand:+ start:9028 stop:9237 length:210 start_codon:yes stop_codon:yes gene_type:complete
MQNGKLLAVSETGKTEMEKSLWKKLIERKGPLNLMELAIQTGICHSTLHDRWVGKGMKVNEYEALEGVL